MLAMLENQLYSKIAIQRCSASVHVRACQIDVIRVESQKRRRGRKKGEGYRHMHQVNKTVTDNRFLLV